MSAKTEFISFIANLSGIKCAEYVRNYPRAKKKVKYGDWIDGDGKISGWISGVHDRKEAEFIITEVNILMKESKFRKVLIDMNKIEKVTMEARKTHLNNIESIFEIFYKFAFFGADTMNRAIANCVIRTSGTGEKVKYFNSEGHVPCWFKG